MPPFSLKDLLDAVSVYHKASKNSKAHRKNTPGPSDSTNDMPFDFREPGPSDSTDENPVDLKEPGPSDGINDNPVELQKPGLPGWAQGDENEFRTPDTKNKAETEARQYDIKCFLIFWRMYKLSHPDDYGSNSKITDEDKELAERIVDEARGITGEKEEAQAKTFMKKLLKKVETHLSSYEIYYDFHPDIARWIAMFVMMIDSRLQKAQVATDGVWTSISKMGGEQEQIVLEVFSDLAASESRKGRKDGTLDGFKLII